MLPGDERPDTLRTFALRQVSSAASGSELSLVQEGDATRVLHVQGGDRLSDTMWTPIVLQVPAAAGDTKLSDM